MLGIYESNRKGMLWWYPEAIPVRGLRVWNGGATALFGTDGEALPALEAFRMLRVRTKD